MKKLFFTLAVLCFLKVSFCQTVGYFNYGRSGQTTWSNHLAINQAGELIMTGKNGNAPSFVVANSSGTYATNRSVASNGELYSPAIDGSGNIFVGGYYGDIGSMNKYIVKYSSSMTQSFAKNFGVGSIRYLIVDGTDIVATGFNDKPCLLKIDNTGGTVWYKEYTVDALNGDAYVVEKSGSTYYMAGNIREAGVNRSYVMAVDAATGNVNWCKSYLSADAPHFTGMSVSPTGIILCGATGLGTSGKLMAVKIDFSGNVVWSRSINNCYSWYQKDPNSYYLWGINCVVDPYGAVVIAYEDDPSYGVLAKLNESTGSVTWIKRYGNSGDGFHGITSSGCTYLATGWFGPSVGSTWDYGLVVADTSGFAGSGGTCGTSITRTSATPSITVATLTVTSTNLTTNSTYASATNTTTVMSHAAVCNTISTTCNIPLPVELVKFTGFADCENETNIFHWVTASEINNDYFTLECSVDGTTWESIGKVYGSGNSSSIQNYQFIDDSPRGRIAYYRLKQTDFNGSTKIMGDVIVLERKCIEPDSGLSIYPNPVSELISFQYEAVGSDCIRILIYDTFGNLVSERSETVVNGMNEYSYNVSNLANGLYMLVVESKFKKVNRKFIKN